MKPTLEGCCFARRPVKGEVTWTDEGGYVGTTDGGKQFEIYGTDSPSPMEMVAHGHAACSLIDLIDGLKHRKKDLEYIRVKICLLYTSPSPRDSALSRMPSSA